MRRSTAVVALVVAGLAPVAACGSSTSGLSQRDFAAKADAICSTLDAQVTKLAKPRASDVTTLAPFAQGIGTAYQSYVTQITQLAATARDRAEITSSWTEPAAQDLAREKPLIDALVVAAQKKDLAAIRSAATQLQAVTDHRTAIEAYQRKIGATTCPTLLADLNT